MAYFRERIFLDYLDFQTGGEKPLLARRAEKDLKLRFDVLAFPNAQFFVAAPAIAKCHDTAYLLGRYSLLWATNRLKYVLDPRYVGNFSIYVSERIKKLQSSFQDEILESHFEYLGYTSLHWRAFFEGYLTSELGERHPYESRIRSGDKCFREETRLALVNDDFIRYLSRNTCADANHIIRIIEDKSDDKYDLFQREAIVREVEEAESVESKVIAILHHELDGSFSRANAAAAGCGRSSDILGINGHRLAIISKHIWVDSRKSLFEVIQSLSPSQLVELSQQSEWRCLIAALDSEIKNKYLDTKGNQHFLNKRLKSMLPSRHFGWLQEIASMIIAYVISPVFDSGAASRYLGAVFSNAPTWILKYLGSISNPQLTVAILDISAKVKHLAATIDVANSQPLSEYGLLYVANKGFVEIAEANLTVKRDGRGEAAPLPTR